MLNLDRANLLRCALLLTFGCANLSTTFAQPAAITRVTATPETITLEVGKTGTPGRVIEILSQGQAVTNSVVVAVPEAAASDKLFLPRFDGPRDRLFSSFQIIGNQGSAAPPRFVEQFDNLARFTNAFPVAASKKGLQVQMVDDALALGIKHAALNINFSQMLDLSGRTNSYSWTVDGSPIHLHRGYIDSLDRQIKPLARAGVVISLILLVYESGDTNVNRLLLHPSYDRKAPNRLGAFNTVTAEGVRHFRACLEFLAHRYAADPECAGRVANFILGNEVNSHWFWANMGRVSMETFAEDYLRTARIASTSLQTISSSARLYLSLEHHWNIHYPGGDTKQTFAARPFLEYFNRRAVEQGNFPWHIAFHPYPENLFEPRTWNDKRATTNADTPRITFKNLEMLPRFLRQPELLLNGQPRKIILSEQGFHTPEKPDGELRQAAGYAYAWVKCAAIPEVDAFILHRHVDHGAEGGLNLGLWTRKKDGRSHADPDRKKLSYEFFRLADTPQWKEAFAPALPVIGIADWNEVIR